MTYFNDILNERLQPVGLNGDWCVSAWHLGPGFVPNTQSGDWYVIDTEADFEHGELQPYYDVVRRWYDTGGNASDFDTVPPEYADLVAAHVNEGPNTDDLIITVKERFTFEQLIAWLESDDGGEVPLAEYRRTCARHNRHNKLQKIEGELRALVVEVWTMTVDDPETATLESESAGMTWERAQLRYLVSLISNAADGTEWAISTLQQEGES